MSLAPWPVTLATREGWAVVAEFEHVAIRHPDGIYWPIGWMYGNPEAAPVTMNGKYAVIVGDGFIVADLGRFGGPVQDSELWEETAAVHRLAYPENFLSLKDVWSFEALYEPGEEGVLRLVADMYSERAGVYELRLPDLALTPLLTRSPESEP